jgi:hypothetical protein
VSIAVALILAAAAPIQAPAQAPARAAASRAGVTVTASVRILAPAVVRLGEEPLADAPQDGEKILTYRQRKDDGKRVLVEFQ